MSGRAHTRVLVADDAPPVLLRIAELLSEIEGVDVVATATDGDMAVAQFLRHAPDIAVLDLAMPGCNGIEVLRAIRDTGLVCRVIIVTSHTEAALRERCLAEGADGFVHKATGLDELLTLVRTYVDHRCVNAG